MSSQEEEVKEAQAPASSAAREWACPKVRGRFQTRMLREMAFEELLVAENRP